MGVFITGIDLSKEQHLFIDRFGVVWREDKIGKRTIGKAIEIKTPHGRLIDENLIECVEDENHVIQFCAPTVIEAEE